MERELITDADLSAYLDGALDDARASEVEVLLAESPALTARLAAYRADKAWVTATLTGLAAQKLPDRLVRTVLRDTRPAAPRLRFGRMLGRPFAPALALLALVAFGWLAYPGLIGPADPLVAAALAARDGNDPAQGTDPTAARDRVTAALGARIRVPDLGKAGYALAGYRTYGDSAVELRYRDAAGKLFTVYLARPSGSDRFTLEQRGAVQICIWQNSDLSVVMTGEMSAKEMLKVASLTYADLDL